MTTTDFAEALTSRADDVLESCTRCGKCFEVCPMVAPAGLGGAESSAVVSGILDLVRGGAGDEQAARWATVCSGSGSCIPACDYGVNPRFMLSLAKLGLQRRDSEPDRRRNGHTAFRKMSRGVHVLSRIQLPPELLALFRHEPAAGDEPADVVFYTGCNLLKTPHIALLCFDILDALGVSYQVVGGPGSCCGVLQYRAGDLTAAGRIAYRTADRFAAARGRTVLCWCPSCQIQLGENVLPGREAADPETFSFDLEPFVVFLDRNIDRLRALMTRRVAKRVALHEHPGVAGVAEAAERILRAVPGLEFVDLAQPQVGWMCNMLQPLPEYKRHIHAELLEAAAEARVTALAGVYHACHRELCSHERDWPFEVVNFLELVGESMGLHREDHFKRLKMMQDVDAILADVADLIQEHGLQVEEVREVVLNSLVAEQPLPLRGPPSE